MGTYMSLRRIALAALLLSLYSCTGTNTPGGSTGSPMPLELTSENFYELLNADQMAASLAGTLLSLGECADNGIIKIAGPALTSASEALADMAHQFRVALALSGSNTFVLQSVEWQTPEQNPGTISVTLQARGMICSA